MPRLARTVYPRVPHHITQRGNRREQVFFTDEDRYAYLGWLREYTDRYEVDVRLRFVFARQPSDSERDAALTAAAEVIADYL